MLNNGFRAKRYLLVSQRSTTKVTKGGDILENIEHILSKELVPWLRGFVRGDLASFSSTIACSQFLRIFFLKLSFPFISTYQTTNELFRSATRSHSAKHVTRNFRSQRNKSRILPCFTLCYFCKPLYSLSRKNKHELVFFSVYSIM